MKANITAVVVVNIIMKMVNMSAAVGIIMKMMIMSAVVNTIITTMKANITAAVVSITTNKKK